MSADTINFLFAIGVVLLQLYVLVLLLTTKTKGARELKDWISEHVLAIGFVLSLAATAGSLLYSNVVGYEPCMFCWFQRIFMYPQAFLFGVALYRKDRGVLKYAFTLSFVGALIALYHYGLQFGIVQGVGCDVLGQSSSCSQQWVRQFGYITIPMMSLSTFAALMGTILVARRKK